MKPSLLITALKFLIETKEPCMVWGPPGVGKSDTVRSAVDQINKAVKKATDKFTVVDLRLSNCDPTDIKGFPMPNAAKKLMDFFPMAMLPTKGNGVLFLDEINAAPQAVQAAAYQLVLNRCVGDYHLPDGWAVIAAGNRASDRSVVHAMPAALANRFIHLDYTVDHEDWIDWAIENQISDITRGYIRSQPADIMTDKIEAGARAFHTPRSWAKADKIINADLPTEVMLPILQGTIGEGMATKLVGFAKNRKDLPNLDRVLINPDDVPVPESPSVRYACIANLETKVNAGNFERILKYIKRMGRDFETVFVTNADRRDPEICETAAFNAWIRENRSVLTGV